MPDNTTLNAATTVGDTIRDLARQAGTVKTQTFQLDLGGATANAEVLISAGQKAMALSMPVTLASDQTPLPAAISQASPGTSNGVQITALTYPQSTGSNSTTPLAGGAVFTGVVETVMSLQAAQVQVVCDQPYTVFVDQFIDAAGTQLSSTYTFTRAAGVPLNENVTLPGNYLRVRVQNTGAAPTTTFRLDTTFGIMDTLPNTLSNMGNLRVVAQENGVVSAGNSTSANLIANAVFTGIAEDVTEFSTIMVSVFSSAASAVDGLQIQQSSDGVNWDLSDVLSIPAATGKTFSFGVQARFYRLVYTNSATITTALRIQTLFSRTPKKFSSVRPQDGRTNENDMEETVAYAMRFNQVTGTWDRWRVENTVLWVTATAATGVAITATLPAAGVGLSHFITHIDIMLYATTARVGGAVPVLVTSTNLPGAPVWNFPTAQAIGLIDRYDVPLLTPLKSLAANTATTIVAPIATTGLWRLNIGYFVGP